MRLELGAAAFSPTYAPRSEERPRSQAPASAPRPMPPCVRFAEPGPRARTLADAHRARALVIEPSVRVPGALGLAIDEAFEAALASRGAMPPAFGPDGPFERVLEDQLLRARALPVRGVCLAVPPLRRLLDERGHLSDEDATVLVGWVETARRTRGMRVVVLLDAEDRDLSLWVPMSLGAWVDAAGDGDAVVVTPPPPVVAAREPALRVVEERVVEEEARDLGEMVAAHIGDTLRPAAPVLPDLDLSLAALAPSVPALVTAAELEDALDAAEPEVPAVAALREVITVREPVVTAAAATAAPGEEAPRPDFRSRMARALRGEPLDIAPPAPSAFVAPAPAEPARPARVTVPAVHADEAEAARLASSATWRSYALELDAARGPRPVAAVEKLFATRYLPMLGAMSRGELDAGMRANVEAWRQGFAESYTEAYQTMRVTGRRPTMVLDAPDVASRVGRLASARTVKLLLIDAMGFDLAERTSQRLHDKVGKRAALVDKTTLWSALPTNTPTQLQLLAKGPEGLRDAPPSVSEPDVSRGRSLTTFRRERLGGREIYKLDLVEARLRGAGPSYDERLDGVAEELSEGLAKLFDTLAPRTLVYVFGDHGVVMPFNGQGGTGPSAQGGASPEEVLVAGHAWLLDAVQ